MPQGGSFDFPEPETPLIGRDAEWLLLEEALTAATAEQGRVVVITGEAGVGKSRLATEIAAEAARGGALVLTSRCQETDRILAFAPWVEAIRGAGIARDPVLLAALDARYRQELARLLPELETDAPRPAPSSAEHLRLFEAVAAVLHRLEDRHPVLVLLDDVHWADEMSLRLLAYLARRIAAWPMLFVVTAREEDLSELPFHGRALAELARHPHSLRVELGALSRDDTLALVHSQLRLDTMTMERVGERIWKASEGYPFIVMEALRASSPEMLGDTAGIPLPARVREITASRLDQLSEPARVLVSAAAVVGREFEFELVRRVAQMSEDGATTGVEELVRRRVLHTVGERFAFRHQRILNVVLDRVLPPRRALLHRRVAETLETLYAGDLTPHYAALGAHYQEAGSWDEAVAYLAKTGDLARERSAFREARAAYEASLVALARLPRGRETLRREIDIRFNLRHAMFPLAAAAELHDNLRRAEAAAAALADRFALGQAAGLLVEHFWWIGRSDLALESGARAMAIAAEINAPELSAEAAFHLGMANLGRGDYRDCERLLREAVTITEDVDVRRRYHMSMSYAVGARASLARCLALRGEFEQALEWGQQALKLADEHDRPFQRTVAHAGLGEALLLRSDPEAALEHLERGYELARTFEIYNNLASLAMAAGYARVLTGRLRDGLALLEEGATMGETLRMVWRVAYRLAWLGEAYLRAGEIERAREIGRRALELARGHGDRGGEVFALRLLAEIAACRDPAEPLVAETLWCEALALAESLEMRPLVTQCRAVLATLR
jgi:tetratricopeptide (TPR) repeat protein